MMAGIAALLAGPARQPGRPVKASRMLTAQPLLALVLCACAVAGTGLVSSLAVVAGRAWHALPLAAASTLLCLVASLPAAMDRPGIPWLLPAWLAVGVGAAGWSLILVPQTSAARAVQVAVLLLPLAVLGVAGAFSAAPDGLFRAAAAAGAGPLATGRLLSRAAMPGVIRTALAVFALSLACLAG